MADNKTIINKRLNKSSAKSVTTISIPLSGAELQTFNANQAKIASAATTLVNSNTFNSTYNMNIDPYMRLLKNVENDEYYDFYFPFSPGEITYEQLSNEIVEVPRAGRTPLVMYKSQKLMKFSFEFTLAVPFDGMFESVSESIELLRKMATDTTRSVQFFNFDDMLTKSLFLSKAPATSLSITEKTAKFFIADLTISSIRRNTDNQITSAKVSMSFIENRNPDIVIVDIPKFVKKKVPTCPSGCAKNPKKKGCTKTCIKAQKPACTESEKASCIQNKALITNLKKLGQKIGPSALFTESNCKKCKGI
jgi:hypothetical protein